MESAPVNDRAGPIAPGERIQVVDILRGFAIFGILLVNMESFGWPLIAVGEQEWQGSADRIVDWLIGFLAEGKFYPLFSFLFGFGLTMQMARSEARGARFVPLYLRRILILLLIGLAHAVLLWMGDILVTYALLGFVLILFRRRRPRTLVIWMVIGVLVTILLYGAGIRLAKYAMRLPGTSERVEQSTAMSRLEAQRIIRVYRQGTYPEIFRQRLAEFGLVHAIGVMFMPHLFALFLLGLYAGQRGLLQDVPRHLPFFRKLLRWTMGVGLLGSVVFVLAAARAIRSDSLLLDFVAVTANLVGGPVLTIGYMSAIVVLVQGDIWQRRLAPLAAVGRMALSNYLLQSLICTTIFYSYGLGLYGRVGPALGVVLTAAIYAVQVPLSVWWLRRFRFGPVEWVWRSLTYGRVQPMRVEGS